MLPRSGRLWARQGPTKLLLGAPLSTEQRPAPSGGSHAPNLACFPLPLPSMSGLGPRLAKGRPGLLHAPRTEPGVEAHSLQFSGPTDTGQ